MSFLSRFSPIRAVRDLRVFLAQREPHELWFLVAAMAITGFFVFAFAHDSNIERVYRPNIIYVEQWRADRSEAEILKQQKIDQVAKDRDMAELKRRQDASRAQFKRIDDSLTKLGI